MDSRRPVTAITRRPVATLPFLVLQLRSKSVANPLLAAPSRSFLVPRRPACLRFTVSSCPLPASASSTGQTCVEDSDVLVNPLDLEAVLTREEANRNSNTSKAVPIGNVRVVRRQIGAFKRKIEAALLAVERQEAQFPGRAGGHLRLRSSSKSFLLFEKAKKRPNREKIDVYFPNQTASLQI